MKEEGILEETNSEFVKWFSELDKNSGNVAGGKGANLGEMYNAGIPVPPGFVVSAQAYKYFLKEAKIKEKIEKILKDIDYENTAQLDESTKKVRKLIVESELPKEMEEEILESYEILGTSNTAAAEGTALDILKNAAEPIFVAVRSSATAEDLADASFAGQQDSYLNVKGKENLIEHIKKCFASLYTSRATYYRNKKGFEHSKVSLAVVVMKMVDSEKSGVMFSKDPSYNNNTNTIIEAVWGLGEGIVSGKITPDKYLVSEDLEIIDKKISDKKIAMVRTSSGEKKYATLGEEKSKAQVLKNYQITKIAEMGKKLEDHYQKPQDVEFAIENDEIFIVQTRPITTLNTREEQKESKLEGEILLEGLAASPGIASGKVKIVRTMEDLSKVQNGEILVTEMTNPDMVVTMQKSSAIITNEGGLTAHAAIVSREMGIPCIVGTETATETLIDGQEITIDGYSGKVYRGILQKSEKKEILPVTANTKTKIKVIVDLPTFAERASKTNLPAVGLTRIEGIIAESGKHPNFYLQNGNVQDYENAIFKGISGIANYFKEIWVRTSDIRSDEYKELEGAPQEEEANPMLGMHGIRYSLRNPELLKAELNALKKVAEQNTTIGILLPQVINVEEVRATKKILQEINFTNCKVGVMVETPAAIQIIQELCDEGISFISFGTNDLTQYVLALDRGNSEVQEMYNEMHPAITKQISYVIRTCKRNNVESSICGQAGSRKEMVNFLVKCGINSISVNADMAKEISDYVEQLEKEKGELPRQYQPVEKNSSTSQNENISEETEEKIKIFD
jgi:pyruvate, water dikinase